MQAACARHEGRPVSAGVRVYLSFGLAAVLGFIGIKLVLDALHGNNMSFVNGGEPIEWAPHIPIWLSLIAIVGALGVATIASLAKTWRDARGDSS